ncbi:ISNCY family transposase [bacterium]|nr:ISNCY family transposase [bacterium]NBW98111.1 ISNCY family transposase [bacterium]NBX81529.1 ISNCY family transposase [bacterium]
MERDEGIYMSKRGQFFYSTVSDFLNNKLCRKDAAELLEVTERSVTRMARRVEEKGLFAGVHGNRGKTPWNKKDGGMKKSVMSLVEKQYFDFNVTHCLEKLREDHGINIGYETLRRWCHEKKLVKRAKKRKTKARYKRVRAQSEGLILQMDGSPHRYNGKDDWCLIAAIDDATSDIPYAEFFHSEDTLNCMTVLQRIIEKKGIPYALYVDQAGCFGGGKRAYFNQFKRACEELGIKIIFASSAQGKGRIERAWDTFQDRLIPEMRLRKIISMPAANHYLQEQFLPNYWKTNNTVPAKSKKSSYTPLESTVDLKETLCLKEYRTVNADHTISWEGITYSLQSPVKHSIYRQKIEIRTYQDLTWKAFYAGKCIDLHEINFLKKVS